MFSNCRETEAVVEVNVKVGKMRIINGGATSLQ
jgi:hypothetical protein